MKKALFPLVRPILLAVVAMERHVFYATGVKMRTLARYHQAEGRYIQAQLDRQHEPCAA